MALWLVIIPKEPKQVPIDAKDIPSAYVAAFTCFSKATERLNQANKVGDSAMLCELHLHTVAKTVGQVVYDSKASDPQSFSQLYGQEHE